MIRTESLTKFYGSRCAVRELEVEIADREIVGFLGRNGAGKTTTLRMLAGELAPSSGRVYIDGREMNADSAHTVRWRIGFLPQRPPLYDEMTVRGYLTFAARLRGLGHRVPERVDEIIEMIDAGPYRDERIGRLSDGYRQRVGIGQAIIHRPTLVILDEPTSQLDPAQLKQMRALITRLKEHHTVLLSTHNLPEISQTCDRLLIIHRGELMAQGSEDELRRQLDVRPRFIARVVGEEALVQSTVDRLLEEAVLTSASVERFDGGHAIEATLADDEPHRLARAVIEAGLELTRLQPDERELEAVFLRLTEEKS